MNTRVGNYELGDELGAGGMGSVFRATRVGTGDEVAIKLLRVPSSSRDEAIARFQREIDVGRQVQHAGVVWTIDAGEATVGGETMHYLVMPFVPGKTLRAVLDASGALSEGIYRHMALHLADALAALHSAGIVHRDVKPENIMVTPDDRVVLTDLGIARSINAPSEMSRTGQFVGSLAYAPPEAFEEDATPTPVFDVWALGVVLYEMATGAHPFSRESMEGTLRAVLHEQSAPLSTHGVDEAPFIEALMRRCLDKNAARRPQDGRAVFELLRSGEGSAWWRRMARDVKMLQPWQSTLDVELPFVGRDDERALIRSAAHDRRGQIVLVRGEEGVGRTRLVHEALRDISSVVIGYVRATSRDASSWLSRVLRAHRGDDEMETLVAQHLGTGPVADACRDALIHADATHWHAADRGSLMSVLLTGLRELARTKRLVLWMDDLDGLAPSAGGELVELARAVETLPALLILTGSRTKDDALAAIVDIDYMRVVDLLPLTERGVWSLLRTRFGHDHIADDLANVVHARTGGMPAMIASMVERLESDGYVRKDRKGAWSITRSRHDIGRLPIPTSARDVWKNRVRRLSSDDREVLDVAACMSDPIRPKIVSAVLGQRTLETLRRLTRLERDHRLIHHEGANFVFIGPLAKEIVRDDMPESLRVAYHAALAQALESEDTEEAGIGGKRALERCEQWMQAGRLDKALRYALSGTRYLFGCGEPERTADLRRAFLESDDALDLATISALALPWSHQCLEAGIEPDVSLLVPWLARANEAGNDRALGFLHCAMGVALSRSKRMSEAAQHFRIAREIAAQLDDDELAARSVSTHAQMCVHTNEFDLGLSLLREHERIMERFPPERDGRAINLISQSALLSSRGRFEESLPLAEAALESAREYGLVKIEAEALRVLGAIYDRHARWDEAVIVTKRALALARRGRARHNIMTSHANLSEFLLSLGQYGAAWTHMRSALDVQRDVGDPRPALLFHVMALRLATSMGNRAESRRLRQRVQSLAASSSVVMLAVGAQLECAVAYANDEEWDNVGERSDHAAQLLPEGAPPFWRCRVAMFQGRAAFHTGDTTLARSHLQSAWAIGRDVTTQVGVGMMAGAYLALLEPACVEAVEARHVEWESLLDVPRQIEVFWLRASRTGNERHWRACEDLRAAIRRSLSDQERSALDEGNWLHRRIASRTAARALGK